MVEQIISQADSEFQQSNFDTAVELYTKALSELEQADPGDSKIAEVVQKLADCEYALNKFEPSRTHYQRLVELQNQGDFAGKDKVMALLKLAKSSDKCALLDEAQANFKAAHDLAKGALTPKHFLNRTVVDSYADWLRSTGRDPEMLAELEKALGIEAKKADEIEEVTADTVKVAGSAAGVEKEQESFVVRKRLSKARKKAKITDAAEEAEQKKLEAAKLTLDQQVAERKFLRKTEDASGTQRNKSSRAKLRNVLSEEIEPKRAEREPVLQDDFSPPGEINARPGDSKAAPERARNAEDGPEIDPGLSEQIAALDALESNAPSPVYNVPLSIDSHEIEPEVAQKLKAHKPRRHFSDKLEASRQKKEHETAIMPESSRSFLQHAEAVKRAADPNKEQTADLVQLRSDEQAMPTSSVSEKAVNVAKFVVPVAVLILLGVASVTLLKQSTTPRAVAVPQFATKLLDQRFATADGAVAITLSRTGATISGTALRRQAKIRFWTGDFNDELALVQGQYKNSHWFMPADQGLQDVNGIVLYAEKAPERKIIDAMRDIAQQAQDYFKANADYPSYSTNLVKSAFTNPFTEKTEDAAVFSGVDQHIDSKQEGFEKNLKDGGNFNNEVSLHPGAIHALSLLGQPTYQSDSNNYNWTNHYFYIHGFGRDGKLINSSVPNQTYVVALKNGTEVSPNTRDQAAAFGTGDICISESQPPDGNSVVGKYLAAFLIVAVILFFAMRHSMVPSGRLRRL